MNESRGIEARWERWAVRVGVFFAMLIGPVTQLFLPMVTVRLPSRVGEVDGEAA